MQSYHTSEGYNIPSLTQNGIYKGVMRKSNEMKEIKND